MLGTALSVLNTCLLAALIVFLLKFKASIPNIQDVLEDVGASISEQLQGIFEKAPVKRAMSVLGTQSGEKRADNALRKKVAQKAMDQIPGVGLILNQFDITPLEGLKLINDPLIGPFIQKGIAAAQAGLGKALGSGAPRASNKIPVYGREE